MLPAIAIMLAAFILLWTVDLCVRWRNSSLLWAWILAAIALASLTIAMLWDVLSIARELERLLDSNKW